MLVVSSNLSLPSIMLPVVERLNPFEETILHTRMMCVFLFVCIYVLHASVCTQIEHLLYWHHACIYVKELRE